MTAPVPDLFDLVHGWPVTAHDGSALVASAVEHRLGGVLWSLVERGSVALAESDRRILAATDLAAAAHHRGLWRALTDAQERLAAVGVQAVALKGVAEEARWYDRLGERPCADVDLIVSPDQAHHVVEVFRPALPQHPSPGELAGLITSRRLQHLHFVWEGAPFDLHFDPLKLGLWVKDFDRATESTTVVTGPDGGSVPVLAPELALVGFLTHLNKDRFSYLGAYGDVARVLQRTELDWDLIGRFVRDERIEVPFWKSLTVVAETLGLRLPERAVPPAIGRLRSALWDRLWPPASRLQGHEGMDRHRYHQNAIPLLTGRWPEVARELHRGMLPPKALLDFHRPELQDHGRLRRLSVDRLTSIADGDG